MQYPLIFLIKTGLRQDRAVSSHEGKVTGIT